jgi:hypothetical protein
MHRSPPKERVENSDRGRNIRRSYKRPVLEQRPLGTTVNSGGGSQFDAFGAAQNKTPG